MPGSTAKILCTLCEQGGSCSLAVSSQAYAGVVPSRIEISPIPQGVDDSFKAAIHAANHDRVAKHAREYVNNVHPVS